VQREHVAHAIVHHAVPAQQACATSGSRVAARRRVAVRRRAAVRAAQHGAAQQRRQRSRRRAWVGPRRVPLVRLVHFEAAYAQVPRSARSWAAGARCSRTPSPAPPRQSPPHAAARRTRRHPLSATHALGRAR
jgi:hypothetical protein